VKTIGIVGGLAWPSSAIYYRTINELVAVLPTTRAKFQAAITDLAARGAEVIVLACTEFGMVVQAEDSPVPVIDTTIAHAQAAVEMALADEPPA
jgi:aspartate/glutamate racemase